MPHRHPGLRHGGFIVAIAGAAASLLLSLTLSPAPRATDALVSWDFESEDLGAVPTGCETPDGHEPAQVSDDVAYGGSQSLLLADAGEEVNVGVECVVDTMDGADLQFQLHPAEDGRGTRIALLGTLVDRPETGVMVFQIWAQPDGSIWWFDGLVQDELGWTQVGAAGTLDVQAWNTVRVQVASGSHTGHVYVGSEYVSPIGPVGVSPVETISGLRLERIGDGDAQNVYVDDLSISDGSEVREPEPDRRVRVGDPVVIEETDAEMQMPNTAVVVNAPHGRNEVLVAYPVHGDATHATGTALASSTDHGRTWSVVDERNPFPDEQSFYLTTLDNGDLLAVSYHTFMVDGSDETQAVVPTAVSSDGGRTWTHREGVMSAPEPMRPISDETSRPGERLGGFVLVHSVTEDPDGTLYQSGYGYYEQDERYRQIVLASTDGGMNWEVRGTVAVDDEWSDHPRYEGFCEAGLARTADGDLIAVMRTGNYQPLHQSVSTDDGRTWSEPEPVLAGPDEIPVTGVFPDLLEMRDGSIVLWAGRPGQFLSVSHDGNGQSWTTPVTLDYLNSGNGTLVAMPGNRILTFGDRGADWTPNTPEIKGIWARSVQLLG